MKLKIKLEPGARQPERAHPTDAGLDLFAYKPTGIRPGAVAKIRTGVSIKIPEGHVGLLTGRSGNNSKGKVVLLGIIDSNYIGEIGVLMTSLDNFEQINEGDKVAQLVVVPIPTLEEEIVDTLEETDRGTNGFGSTDK